MPVLLEMCNLQSLFNEIEILFTDNPEVSGNNKFTFRVDINTKEVVFLDVMKLKQILINQIGNAVKFTQNGNIDVTCEFTEGKFLLISVKDTGQSWAA